MNTPPTTRGILRLMSKRLTTGLHTGCLRWRARRRVKYILVAIAKMSTSVITTIKKGKGGKDHIG